MADPSPLLGPDDPPPFGLGNPDGRAPLLLLCDHASRVVPRGLGSLGLDEADLSRHIGWDIGAAEVTRHLAEMLDAPAVLAGYSRLVVDCNRTLDDPTAMPEVSDETVVPANAALSVGERAARAEACYWPYHRAVEAAIGGFLARGVFPAVLSIHSFTPCLVGGPHRPWEIGVLWDRDPRIAVPLMAGLAEAAPRLTIGDNEPYSAREPSGFTLPHHVEPRGLPHALLELRQDEIGTAAGARYWAVLLAQAMRPILADAGLFGAPWAP